MILIAAHMRLMSDVCRPIYDAKFKKGNYPSQDQLVDTYVHNFPWIVNTHRGRWICPEEIEYVKNLAFDMDQGVRHGDHGILAFFSRRGIQFCNDDGEDQDQCEALWWMLMLRGVAWTMSCLHQEPAQRVPPVFYGNKTPVWIT